jgi:excinuclease UvrABC ATPase subunit
LIDIGPGRGEHGGELIWNGSLDRFCDRFPAKSAGDDSNRMSASRTSQSNRYSQSLTR